jgi:hypothetical protein
MNIAKNTSGIAALGLLLSATAPTGASATAIPAQTIFNFSGDCDDCVGTFNDGLYQHVTGTLVLQNFIGGVPLNLGNFVSFHYDGSNLLAPFTVNANQASFLIGTLAADGRVLSPFDLFFGSKFEVAPTGQWLIDNFADVGPNGTFSVPEPATLAIFGLGLLALGVTRRSRAA